MKINTEFPERKFKKKNFPITEIEKLSSLNYDDPEIVIHKILLNLLLLFFLYFLFSGK